MMMTTIPVPLVMNFHKAFPALVKKSLFFLNQP